MLKLETSALFSFFWQTLILTLIWSFEKLNIQKPPTPKDTKAACTGLIADPPLIWGKDSFMSRFILFKIIVQKFDTSSRRIITNASFEALNGNKWHSKLSIQKLVTISKLGRKGEMGI